MQKQLTNSEKNRYSRHISLDAVGLLGQEKLKAAKVLVIGAGGLGCPVLQYLTAAGVGTIGIIDFDTIEESNLQRQILFTTNDIGKSKAKVAALRLAQLNPYVNFNVFNEKLTTKNAVNLFSAYDIIVDGTDNFSTRYLVNDACLLTSKPLVYGAIYKFEGQVTVFNYNNGPSYRCLFPEPPNESPPNCSDIGVIGVLPGIIGTQQANEVIKMILEIGEPLSGKLLTYNALNNTSFTLKVKRSDSQIEKVLAKDFNFEAMDYDFFCGIKKEKTMQEISIEELKEWYQKGLNFKVLDVRDEWEQPRLEKDNVLQFPLDELDDYVEEIKKYDKVVIICQHGIRSVDALQMLQRDYQLTNLINLSGGIVSWNN